MYWTNSFISRMLFNSDKAYVKQLDKGHLYNELCPIYGLSLVNHIYLSDKSHEKIYYHHYKLLHQEIPNEEPEGIRLIFIELPKFTPQTYTEKKLRNLWLRFLTEIDENTNEVSEELYNEKALEQLHISAFTKEEFEYYNKYWDKVRVEKATIMDAKKSEQQALKDKEKNEKLLDNEGKRQMQTIKKMKGLSNAEISELEKL